MCYNNVSLVHCRMEQLIAKKFHVELKMSDDSLLCIIPTNEHYIIVIFQYIVQWVFPHLYHYISVFIPFYILLLILYYYKVNSTAEPLAPPPGFYLGI